MKRSALVLVLAAAVLAPPVSLAAAPAAAPAATGRVLGPDGAPVFAAQVCTYNDGVPIDCVDTDSAGYYRMENPARATLFIRARGFVPATVSSAPQNAPIVLELAATLRVRVVDAATREPIGKGVVTLAQPSGRRIGSAVPFNRAGVRMSTLEPGETLVRAEAEGYTPGGPVTAVLVSGHELEVVIEMKKAAAK